MNVIRVQNRRPDVDGEYIYACRYWHSTDVRYFVVFSSVPKVSSNFFFY